MDHLKFNFWLIDLIKYQIFELSFMISSSEKSSHQFLIYIILLVNQSFISHFYIIDEEELLRKKKKYIYYSEFPIERDNEGRINFLLK